MEYTGKLIGFVNVVNGKRTKRARFAKKWLEEHEETVAIIVVDGVKRHTSPVTEIVSMRRMFTTLRSGNTYHY